MTNFRIAVKAVILQGNNILLLKRRSNDVHKPNTWDIPGGRLNNGENPYEGLKRETKEETGLDIDIVIPIDVHHFIRDDEQKITMIIFVCKTKSKQILLSEEHQEYIWIDLFAQSNLFPEWMHGVIEKIKRYIYLEKI